MPRSIDGGLMLNNLLAQTSAPAPTVFSVDDVLAPYIYVFYAAFLISWIFTPIMRSVAIYYGIIDQPDKMRKIHKTPVAYLGGVAVFLGWMCGLAASQFLLMHRIAPGLTHARISTGIIGGACIILLLGLWDDLRQIRPWVKIVGQIAAGAMLLNSGIGTEITNNFLDPIVVRMGIYLHWQPSADGYALFMHITSAMMVFGLVVFCCNATNLMDGLDGLCGGVTAIVSMGFVILAVYIAMNNGVVETNNDAVRVIIALALLGAVLGFVPYNFNPASIFMGDTGSMFLGFVCALMIILMGEVASRWFLSAMVMFAMPVLDTSLAFARRWVNKRPFFSADKQHFHHQLVARGMSVRKAVVFIYILTILFVICGTAILFMRTRYAGALYLVIFCSIIVAAKKMGMVHERTAVVTRKPIQQSNAIATPNMEPESVLEVRESDVTDRPTGGLTIPGAWSE